MAGFVASCSEIALCLFFGSSIALRTFGAALSKKGNNEMAWNLTAAEQVCLCCAEQDLERAGP
jgi:hypothetical protein